MSLTGLGGRLFSSPRLPEEEALSLPRPDVASWVPDRVPDVVSEPVVAGRAWNWREIWSNVAEITGFGSISAGLWLISPSGGLISAGVGLIVIGASLGRNSG